MKSDIHYSRTSKAYMRGRRRGVPFKKFFHGQDDAEWRLQSVTLPALDAALAAIDARHKGKFSGSGNKTQGQGVTQLPVTPVASQTAGI